MDRFLNGKLNINYGNHRMSAFEVKINRQAIEAACRRHGVARLDVFGYTLREYYMPDKSDLDFLVEFGSMEPYARVNAYFGLLEELRAMLGSKLDLVMTGAVKNPYVAKDVKRTRRVLYAA